MTEIAVEETLHQFVDKILKRNRAYCYSWHCVHKTVDTVQFRSALQYLRSARRCSLRIWERAAAVVSSQSQSATSALSSFESDTFYDVTCYVQYLAKNRSTMREEILSDFVLYDNNRSFTACKKTPNSTHIDTDTVQKQPGTNLGYVPCHILAYGYFSEIRT